MFVHFRPDIQAEVADNIPKEMFAIPEVNVYNTRNLQPLRRNSHLRWLSENRVGASIEYPPFKHPRTNPLSSFYHANVVTFWPTIDSLSGEGGSDYVIEPSGNAEFEFGKTLAYDMIPDSNVFIPSSTQRILVRLGSIQAFGEWSNYYDVSSMAWQNAYSKLIRWVIIHEFGHSIGMKHKSRIVNGIMYVPTPEPNSDFDWPTMVFPTENMNEFLIRRPLP